ncbi:dynamin family protein [Epibacterium sp. Ofav1-8]|uniref:dynamin family protein n=1 Tax=Epibacterium sp. Ofav1-8 TaxID=2917735 RepID=UPI001EF59408|nr:dynamin family protein [Epibacterium sp. Ofav1-8]MCG7624443.1 dynamin family protein [Epibacterium sp. Ofav1-8]
MYIDTEIDSATDLRAATQPGNLAAGLAPLHEVAQDLADLRAALDQLAQGPGEKTARNLARLDQDLAQFEPAVTFLGQVKSGKTTLVNALAGWSDLLPSDVNPWTSVVTSLHLSPGQGRAETSARFRFMTEAEWDHLLTRGGRMGEMAGRAGAAGEMDKIRSQVETMRDRAKARLGRKFELLMGQSHDYGYFDKNLIERYICLGDDPGLGDDADAHQGRFADVTRSADLYLGSPVLPCKLCLRDTPGVNDTFLMREQITLQALRDSRVCVVVLTASQALSTVDLGLIRMLSNLQAEQVVLFVNRIDELSEPAVQVPEIETALRATLKAHHVPGGAEIIFGSALWANAVLAGDLDAMPRASAQALFNWVEANPLSEGDAVEPPDLVWALSGLPALNRAIATRVAETDARPLIRRIAQEALTLATARDAAEGIRVSGVSGDRGAVFATPEESLHAFDTLTQAHLEACGEEIDAVLQAFAERADRAHDTFLDRATHALIAHLQEWGEGSPWQYDPTGLRLLLRSAYSVMGKQLKEGLEDRYSAALSDVARHLYDACGDAVAGIQIAVPDAPALPAPVALAQTIALDVRDSWWGSWWRRARGYAAFAETFRTQIAVETHPFMTALKVDQAERIRTEALGRLQDTLRQHRDILVEITDAMARGHPPQSAPLAAGHRETSLCPATLRTLRRLTD